MRSMGSAAGAVPRSNSGRARRWVLPLSTVRWVSSTACVMSGPGVIDTDGELLDSCATRAAETPPTSKVRVIARMRFEGYCRQIFVTSTPALRKYAADKAVPTETGGAGGEECPSFPLRMGSESALGKVFVSQVLADCNSFRWPGNPLGQRLLPSRAESQNASSRLSPCLRF